MVKRKNCLSLWKVSNSSKYFYVVWNNPKDIERIFSKKVMFMNEPFQIKKIPDKRKILISLDEGKNYYRLNKILKILDNKIINEKISEPYILSYVCVLCS